MDSTTHLKATGKLNSFIYSFISQCTVVRKPKKLHDIVSLYKELYIQDGDTKYEHVKDVNTLH